MSHETRNPVVQRLYATIEGVLDVPTGSIDSASSPDTVSAWDSLNHLNLAVAIEAEFGVTLSPQEVIEMRSVAEIEKMLRERGADFA